MPLVVAATAGPAPALTLDEAVEQALIASHDLVATREARDAARGFASAEAWSRLPILTGSVDVRRGDHPVYVFGSLLGQERFGSDDFGSFDPGTGALDLERLNAPEPITNVRTAITARLTLWSGGAISAGTHGARERALAAEGHLGRTKRLVRTLTEEAYRLAFLTGERLDVLRMSLGVARAELARVERLFAEGLALEADVDQLRALVAEREAEIAGAIADSSDARSLLAYHMGGQLPVGDVLDLPPSAADLIDLEVALAHAGDRHDVRAAAAEWRAERAAVGGARAGLLPSLELAASLEHNDEEWLGDGGTQWLVGAGLAWTFDPGQPARAGAAAARARAADARQRAVLDTARREIRAAHARSVAARARARALSGAVAAAEEAYRLVRRRHVEGLVTTLELMTALDTLTRTRVASVTAEQEHGMAIARLRLAAGEAAEGGMDG